LCVREEAAATHLKLLLLLLLLSLAATNCIKQKSQSLYKT